MSEIKWNELRDKAHANAVEHGFWENKPSNEHFLCLVISELMEAVEAHRKRNRASVPEEKKDTAFDPSTFHSGNRYFRLTFEDLIKDTIEDELADAVIRVMDLAGANNVNLNGRFCISYVVTKKNSFTENIYAIVKDLVNSRYNLEEKLNYCRMQICKLAEIEKIDLLWHIQQKMYYNESREKMHGKSY